MVKLSDSHVEAIIMATLQNAWRRGCTCGTAARVELLSDQAIVRGHDTRLPAPPRIKAGIEHLAECPLWKPIPMADLGKTEPDALEDIHLP